MMKMRCAICGIRHESNSFSTLKTQIDNFGIARGDEITAGDFWKSFEDVEWVPTLVAGASPHGLVSKEAYLELKNELISRLRDGMPVDGVYMSLHGAMHVEGIGDGETDLIKSVREVVGSAVPIAGSLDLHGNISPELAASTNALTAYRTAPHVDGAETRERAVNHLIRCMRGEVKASNVLIKLPLLLPGEYAVTEAEPARSLYAKLPEIESQEGILDASILIGCAWTDSPYTSVSVIIVGEGDGEKAHEAAVSLANEIWSRRSEFVPEVEVASVEEAVRIGIDSDVSPVVISDSGDNVTAGGAGDIPIFLEKLLSEGAANTIVAGLTDPDAVKACIQAGVGSEVALTIGGKLDKVNGYPFGITGMVESLNAPSAALLKVGGVRLILVADRRAVIDINSFQSLGVDPREQQIVVVKVGLLHSDIRDVAKKPIMALSPGLTSLALDKLPYRQIKRPIFPLVRDFEWNAAT